ncbi:hypothetical protein [Neolewinella agarilytica]|uniref:Uncharacterized protein n=1 Tax=Neolewinella agarilytica TaxID=478744 RepID=A0A1H8Z884_9BACT|nr:hypothetical protein [Neolewinella agarilytica]SEP60551.1 hypothetical protein SAMN05444359_101214 [Neolewinella agarilytica]
MSKKTYHFTCTLLSRLVLSSRAATEGQVDSLDYIPGAKFMGIVAKGYEKLDATACRDLFHSGHVKFSNAYPYANGQYFFPTPLSYFTLKGQKLTDAPIYLDHLLKPEDRKKLSKDGTQIKQVRSGYIDARGKQALKIETDFQLKSAHDAEKRRSKDSQMYGYFSIPRGTVFAFSVEDTTENHGAAIREALVGEHGVGRSRTAEYGRVRIEALEEAIPSFTSDASTTEGTLVYAVSDLCFYDAFGQPKRPEAKDLGFDQEAKIDWARTQVRSEEYQSWNSHRWNRNADRWVIKKGTVFFVKGAKSETIEPLRGVGSHHEEGFGQIWIDPPFLQKNTGDYCREALTKADIKPVETNSPDTAPNTNPHLLALLNRRVGLRDVEGTIYQKVNTFIGQHKGEFSGISASQWGALRNYANHAADEKALEQLIFNKDTGFLHRGQSESSWRKGRDTLQTVVKSVADDHQPLFLQKLAAEMAKEAQKQTA